MHKLITWAVAHEKEITEYTLSLGSGISIVYTYQQVFDWFVHTAAACVSALIVSAFVYFGMRIIKKWSK